MRRLVPLLALASLVGCRHDPTVVGSWTGTLSGYDVKADFAEDKTLRVSPKVGTYGADITGTYQLDSKDLTLQFKTYKLKGVPGGPIADTANQLMDGFVKRPIKVTYHFNDEDDLALTYQGKTDILKRVKEDQ